MKDIMIRSLITLIASLFLTACGKKGINVKGDSDLLFDVHTSVLPQEPNWKEPELKQRIYFGKYLHSSDRVQKYFGDPLGAIVAIWKITHYLGEKPNFKNCGKEPKRPSVPAHISLSSPEYENFVQVFNKTRDSYYDCRHTNKAITEKTKKITYYYARSPQIHQPVLPPRVKNHSVYEVHVSYGPLSGVPLERLPEVLKAKKDQLTPWPWHCYWLNTDRPKNCYRLPGNENNLFYKVRNILKEPPTKGGMSSSPWQEIEDIRLSPENWEEIKSIEISKAQYDYMQKRCKYVFSCYLDDKAPDLTEEQKSYIKATAWDIDTDEKARNEFIKKADGYRHDKQSN